MEELVEQTREVWFLFSHFIDFGLNGCDSDSSFGLVLSSVLAGRPPTCNIFGQQVNTPLQFGLKNYVLIQNLMVVRFLQYAFNMFSHNAPITENGYNEEEVKLVKETRKIWVSVFT